MPLVEIKDFNALIDNTPFFDQPVKNKQETSEKLIEMSQNDDYTTGNVLDNLYNRKCYKLVGIDLSRQTKTSISQKINFEGKLFFISEKQQKTILNFSVYSLIVIE